MDEKLISGYAAFTTSDEYGAGSVGTAPATSPAVSVASTIVFTVISIFGGC